MKRAPAVFRNDVILRLRRDFIDDLLFPRAFGGAVHRRIAVVVGPRAQAHVGFGDRPYSAFAIGSVIGHGVIDQNAVFAARHSSNARRCRPPASFFFSFRPGAPWIVDVEHVEEQQGGFFVVELIDVHGFKVSFKWIVAECWSIWSNRLELT